MSPRNKSINIQTRQKTFHIRDTCYPEVSTMGASPRVFFLSIFHRVHYFCQISVLCPPECTAVVSFDLVRGASRIPKEKHSSTNDGNFTNWSFIPDLLCGLYSCATFRIGANAPETVYQIYLPFCLVYHVPL